MNDSTNAPQWDYPNVDESPRLTSLLHTAGERFAKLDAIGGLSAVLGIGVVLACSHFLQIGLGSLILSAIALCVIVLVVAHFWKMKWLRELFVSAFKNREEQLAAGCVLAGVRGSEPAQALRRAIGMTQGGCSCSQCGRSVRRLVGNQVTCKGCKVELSTTGYPCPNCGSPGSVFTSQQRVAEGRARARKNQVRGPVDWLSSAAGTASAADELQSSAGKDVFRCSCAGKWGVPETWGVPLSRVGHPFPDGLPRLK